MWQVYKALYNSRCAQYVVNSQISVSYCQFFKIFSCLQILNTPFLALEQKIGKSEGDSYGGLSLPSIAGRSLPDFLLATEQQSQLLSFWINFPDHSVL